MSHLLVAQLESAEKMLSDDAHIIFAVTCHTDLSHTWKVMGKYFFIEIHQIPAGFQWIPVCSTRNFWYPTGICGAVRHSDHAWARAFVYLRALK